MYGAHPAIEGMHALRDSAWRDRAGSHSDRPRRPQPAELVSVRHGLRAQCAGQDPLQRTRLDALVHEVSHPTRSGSIWTGERRKSALPPRAAAMNNWRRTIQAGDIYHALAQLCGLTTETDAKRWKGSPEGQVQRPRMKAAAARHQLRDGGAVTIARARPASADRQRSHHPASATLPGTYWAWREAVVTTAMLERRITSEFDGWPLHLSHIAEQANALQFSDAIAAAPRCCGWRPTGYARPT